MEHVTPEYQQQLDNLAESLTDRFKPAQTTLYFSGVCRPDLVPEMVRAWEAEVEETQPKTRFYPLIETSPCPDIEGRDVRGS